MDQYNFWWLNDLLFIYVEFIFDSVECNDDKFYFFFCEWLVEVLQSFVVYVCIGCICLNDDGGYCCLVNKWSIFLKVWFVCFVLGEDGIEIYFDEFQDVFVQQIQDVRNFVIYVVFIFFGFVF